MMKRYLADGVYAAIEESLGAPAIVLTTENGVSTDNTIYCDADVVRSLEDYVDAARSQGMMPRRAREKPDATEMLGSVVETTELVAAIRESLRPLLAESTVRGDEALNHVAKGVAKDLFEFPVVSRTAADLADRTARSDEESRDASEIYCRASTALSAAGVPHDVGNNDPLEQLAARVRWLQRRRPVVPLTRGDAIGTVARALLSFKHLEAELGDETLPCYVDKVAAAIVDALGVGA